MKALRVVIAYRKKIFSNITFKIFVKNKINLLGLYYVLN